MTWGLSWQTRSERMADLASGNLRRTPERPLTMRECQVLEWAAEGFSNKEIAREMNCEPSTISWHVKRILHHLNARDRVHAVALAIRRGLIS